MKNKILFFNPPLFLRDFYKELEGAGGESKISNQIITEGIKPPIRIFIKRLWRK